VALRAGLTESKTTFTPNMLGLTLLEQK